MDNDQIIQKIKNENLKPINRNVFVLRKSVVWLLLLLTTIFGAYAFAIFFLRTLYIDFDNWHYFSNTYNGFLWDNIPMIWILFFVFSLFLMFYLFKQTNKGYKYSIIFIGAASLIVSFLLGAVLAKALAYQGAILDQFERERFINWTSPEEGRLSGEVLFSNQEYILLRDIKDDVWNVNTTYILDNSREVLENNQVISIVGKYDYANNFTACQIMPLNIDKTHFKPNPINRLKMKIKTGNTFAKDICDFVINRR